MLSDVRHKMKKKLRYIAGLTVVSLVALFAAIGFWPQRIQVVGSAVAHSRDLTLAIWKDGGFEETAILPDGRVTVGRGAWRAPWASNLRGFAIYDDKTMYWEGVVRPPVVGDVEIALGEGRPRTNEANKTDMATPGKPSD